MKLEWRKEIFNRRYGCMEEWKADLSDNHRESIVVSTGGDKFVVSCALVKLFCEPLSSLTIEEAKKEAVARIKDGIEGKIVELDKVHDSLIASLLE